MSSRTDVHVDRSLRVRAEPVSVAAARRFVTELLTGLGCTCALRDDAELMLSELVTNAVRHQRDGKIEITAVLRGSALRVSVTDDSHEVPQPRSSRAEEAPSTAGHAPSTAGQAPSIAGHAPSAEAASGRGLLLIEALATRWGWAPLEKGKVVWFEAVCRCQVIGAA
jgi:anti-sigma regulatory factor (Ser/Thr protein kinase)